MKLLFLILEIVRTLNIAGHIVTRDLKIISDSRIRSTICKGPKYRLSLPIGSTDAGALQEFCNRWCKREHVESNVLNTWKLNIFDIIDSRISFIAII